MEMIILVFSTKKLCSSFLKTVFVFQNICFKVKVLKIFETFTDCHIKPCRSLKRRAILLIPSVVFYKNLCSFCWRIVNKLLFMMEIYITCLIQILSFSSRFRRFEMKNFFVGKLWWPTILHN